ncbi:unnamed protein product [Fraxinus pennsylvanica]|uniref:Uncharacterized protein n=1 Tax=Fraxinus pennsylvanica TaxID=56036 RepID=A0AAD1YSL3_9LAMI|nr:unnamed protein product [Fraxinus pennsylvanica]
MFHNTPAMYVLNLSAQIHQARTHNFQHVKVPAGPKIPESTCAKSFEAKDSQGVIWIWMSHKKTPNASGKNQRYKKRSRTKSDGSESLSDIDDSEVKKQKPATETKKTTSVGKAVKTTKKLEQQMRSSRINYDALRLLNDDTEQGSGTANNIDLKLDSWRNDDSQNENTTTLKMQRSEEGNYDEDEDQQQITCGEDDVMFGHQCLTEEVKGQKEVVVYYDWTEEWHPLYLTKNVPEDAPLGLTVFDQKVVFV